MNKRIVFVLFAALFMIGHTDSFHSNHTFVDTTDVFPSQEWQDNFIKDEHLRLTEIFTTD